MAEEENKNPGDDNQPPTQEQLATPQRDPDEAVFAEQAIQEYAAWVLDAFSQNTQTALDNFSAWAQGQAATQNAFNDSGFFAQAGQAFVEQMMAACGGADSPIGQHIIGQLNGPIDQAVRDEAEVSFFVTELSRSIRDVCWYLRDNLQAILSNQWDQLLDLAYEGSTEFVPVLHHFGLPTAETNPADLQGQLQSVAQAYAASVPKKQEEVEEEAPKEETAQAEEQEQQAEQAQEQFQQEKEAEA
jgi:hypothetical protein